MRLAPESLLLVASGRKPQTVATLLTLPLVCCQHHSVNSDLYCNPSRKVGVGGMANGMANGLQCTAADARMRINFKHQESTCL